MILTRASYKIETPIDGDNAVRLLKQIEAAARTCYKSECKITEDSYKQFVRKIIGVLKHESVCEHGSITVRFITDRGVTHELVRHRLAAFSQESTRYVDYSDDKKTSGHCQFIIPCWMDLPEGEFYYKPKLSGAYYLGNDEGMREILDPGQHGWLLAMQEAEDAYQHLRSIPWSPQQARSVLPNSTKTEIVVTANPREWRHILSMRTSNHAHPQIREIMIPVLKEFTEHLPELFEDIKADS